MVKILVVGDPHGHLKYPDKILRESDLILITGDLGKADFARKRFFENIQRKKKGLDELEYTAKDEKFAFKEIYDSTLKVLKKFSKYAPTYFILGNIGTTMIKNSEMEKDEKKYGIKLPRLKEGINSIENCFLVRNRVLNLEGIRVGFLEYFNDVCWDNEFGTKDKKKIKMAKKETKHHKKVLNNFKKLDFFIFHQPPYGVLDRVGLPAPKAWHGKHAGSKVILNYIKKEKPSYGFCGHIHEAVGKDKIGKTILYNLGASGSYLFLDFDNKTKKFNEINFYKK